MKKRLQLPDIPEEDQTPLVKGLMALLEQFAERIQLQDEEIALLKDEINILKSEKKRPKIKPSKLDKNTDDNDRHSNTPSGKGSSDKPNRPGSKKRPKNSQLTIHEEQICQPSQPVPEGSRFKGYRSFVVQELEIKVKNILYKREHWVTPSGTTLTGELPEHLNNRHFGSQLNSFILYQHHHCQTTQPLLLEQLREWGVDISTGQINEILLSNHEAFHEEKEKLLEVGLSASSYITVDDSGARHKGKNGYVTHIGNEFFAWFSSTYSKSRINFLSLLRAGHEEYRLTEDALAYMRTNRLPQVLLTALQAHPEHCIKNKTQWLALLKQLSITKKRHCRIATEGALLGCVLYHGMCDDLAIISDDAGQFNILLHGLCWVHAERLIHKLIPLNETQRKEIALVRDEIWTLYRGLKNYKKAPTQEQKEALAQQFDSLFTQTTSFATLNAALKRLHKNKSELLLVLDRPEVPLHTNGSETDIRDYVKKNKVSGGTRSDLGRRCRDTFASLKKTCRKLKISFWKYINARLDPSKYDIEPLPDIVLKRASASGY